MCKWSTAAHMTHNPYFNKVCYSGGYIMIYIAIRGVYFLGEQDACLGLMLHFSINVASE